MPWKILFDLKHEYYYHCFVSILKAMAGDSRFETAFYVGVNEERRWGVFPVSHRRATGLSTTRPGSTPWSRATL
jgi:hypothetical protein